MLTALLLATMFISGVLFGTLLGAALAGLGYHSRDQYRAFDGGFEHENPPPRKTRIIGGGVEAGK